MRIPSLGRNYDSLLIRPTIGNSLNFPWLVIWKPGSETSPPTFFLGHGRNFHKYAEKQEKGEVRIIGHVKEKEDAIVVCKKYNDELKKRTKSSSYQQSHSNTPINVKDMKNG